MRSPKNLIVVGERDAVEAMHDRLQCESIITSMADNLAVVAYHMDNLVDATILQPGNEITPDLQLPCMKCDKYHAIVDRNGRKMLLIAADIPDSDSDIIRIVEWARALFNSLKWDKLSKVSL